MDVDHRPEGVRSIDRALSVLELLAVADRGYSLGELSSAAGLPVGTTHRIVRTLVARGYVRQLVTRAYVLGPALVGLGDRARYRTGIGVEPCLRDLAERAGTTAGLAVLDGPDVVFVAQAAVPNLGVRVVIELGVRAPFGSAVVADAILASLPPEALRRPPASELLRHHRCPDLAGRLAEVRRRGYAVGAGRDGGGVGCLAVGLTRQAVPAAVALVGIGDGSAELDAELPVELLRGAASAVERELAGHE